MGQKVDPLQSVTSWVKRDADIEELVTLINLWPANFKNDLLLVLGISDLNRRRPTWLKQVRIPARKGGAESERLYL